MGYTVLALPPVEGPGCPVRNPQWLEVESDLGETLPGAKAQFTLQLLTTAVAGNSITITWPRGTVTMTGISGSGGGTTGTGFGVAYGTVPTLRDHLLTQLRLNYYLQRDFIMEAVSTDSIQFTARTLGDAWHPSITSCTPGSLGTFTTDQIGKDTAYADNYSMALVLEVEEVRESDTYTRLPQITLRPGPDKLARANLADMLLPYLRQPTWPAYNRSTSLWASGQMRRFKGYVLEYQGDPSAPRILTDLYPGTTARAWLAGARRREQEAFHTQLVYLGTQAGSRWLTYRGIDPDKHEVSAAQQHYLMWFDWGVGYEVEDNLRLHFKVHYTDGTTDDKVVLCGVLQRDLHIFPTGFDTYLLGDLQPAKTPYKYEAWLTLESAGSGQVVAAHTFHLVEADYNEQHLEFLNSFGAIESLRCIGSWEQGLEMDWQEAGYERPRDSAASLNDPQQTDVVNLHRASAETIQISTGFMDRGEMLAVIDVLYSPQLRLVDHDRKTKTGCRLLNTTHLVRKQGAEDEHLYALNLELQVGDTDRATSQVLAWAYTPA